MKTLEKKNSKFDFFRLNNFDFIRLFAASQVALVHGITHLEVEVLNPYLDFLNLFPGVPIFFFLSGFLISASWERNSNVTNFSLNRFYRIFPGLWGCILFSILLIFLFSFVLGENVNYFQLLYWLVMQGTFFPQWNPDFLSWFGVGVVNGSLWTIPVELTFYFFLPLIYFVSSSNKIKLEYLLLFLALLSFSTFYFLINFEIDSGLYLLFKKILSISFIPWIGMFCLGVLAQRYVEILHKYLANKVFLIFILFFLISILGTFYKIPVLFGSANDIGILNYLVLCALVFSMGYSNPELSDKYLQRNDISYGIYIYHMLIFNSLIMMNQLGLFSFILGIFLTIFIAYISWIYLENPMLKRKKISLYKRL